MVFDSEYLQKNWSSLMEKVAEKVAIELKTNYHSFTFSSWGLCAVAHFQNFRKTSKINHSYLPCFTVYTFLIDFLWNMLGDSINIIHLCCNPAVLKKNWYNLLKIVLLLDPICIKKGLLLWAMPKMENNFFCRYN